MKRVLAFALTAVMLFSLCSCSILNYISSVKTVGSIDFEPSKYDTCYYTLNEQQQEIYKVLYNCALLMPEGFVTVCDKYEGDEVDLNVAYTAMLYDNPQIFWMPVTYMIGSSTGLFSDILAVAFKYTDENNDVDYLVSKDAREIMEETLEKRVNEILKDVPVNNKYEAQLYLDDYLCKNIEYQDNAQLGNTVYGALVRGKALCEGYAKSYKLLCNKIGIECELTVGDGEKEAHMWNTVYTDGQYAYTDVTWDDIGVCSSRMYFNISENSLLKNHKLYSVFAEMVSDEITNGGLFNFNLRQCNTSKNSYFEKSKLVLSDDYASKAALAIVNNLQEGKLYESFYLQQDANSIFTKNKQSFVAQIQEQLATAQIEEFLYDNQVLVLFYKEVEPKPETEEEANDGEY